MKIKDLKRNQYFWYAPVDWSGGERVKLKVWGEPYIGRLGAWEVDCTCDGDYCWIINESQEQYISEATFHD